MNKTKTNSHFLPMEKLFLLFTYSSPLPSQLHCGRDGIAEDGGGGTAAASTRQGEQGQLGGALHSPKAGGGERQPEVPVSIPMPAKTILSSYQQRCTVT